MKTLFLLRHAKSSWNDAALTDRDRPLNDRGIAAAPFMGRLLAGLPDRPDMVISSPAVRAVTTAQMVTEAGKLAAGVVMDERIYEATPSDLMHVLMGIDDSLSSVMLVGHNPGMESLIEALTSHHERMPTAALAILDLDTPTWSAISSGCGKVRAVYRPRDEMY